MTDSQMIDWLESQINEHGAILLHDGNSNPHGHLGVGLRPGSLRRTLRDAITQAGSTEMSGDESPANLQGKDTK